MKKWIERYPFLKNFKTEIVATRSSSIFVIHLSRDYPSGDYLKTLLKQKSNVDPFPEDFPTDRVNGEEFFVVSSQEKVYSLRESSSVGEGLRKLKVEAKILVHVLTDQYFVRPSPCGGDTFHQIRIYIL